MQARQPPRAALWLLAHCVGSRHAESLAGDLVEEFNRGRSAGWVWRQVLIGMLQPLVLQAVLKRLLRMFALIALGAGTLTWASTVRHETCGIAGCVGNPTSDISPAVGERCAMNGCDSG